ncbi:uncharacterized protein LOC135490664 [Lineus longissimus]|uniref:uncharacterized protein LOC135490664 n=1 Tax=Lineus longissimus TaxID=88925 RepID=UPI00315C5614
MKRGGSVKEQTPVVSSGVLKQRVKREGACSDDKAGVERGSPVAEVTSIPLGDFNLDKLTAGFYQIQKTCEDMPGNNRVGDQFRTSVDWQSEGQCGHRTLPLMEGSDFDCKIPMQSSSNRDNSISRGHRHIPVPDEVSSDLFFKVSKENVMLKRQLAAVKKELAMRQSSGDFTQLDRHIQALEKEKLHLRQELKRVNSMLISDGNGHVIHHTVDEIIDPRQDALQQLLNAEKDKNRKVEEECWLLKEQVKVYEEDFHAEKEQQKKKEISWDTKFTIIRATNEKLARQVKEKDMVIEQLHTQYRKEFDSKMKIQEDFEKRKHEPFQATTSTPGSYPSSQRSYMMSGASYELNHCGS